MEAPPRRTCAGRRTGGLRPWQKGNDKLHTRGGVWPCCRLARAICYGALDRGVAELTSLSDLRLARIAAIGALIAALGLAGCGRKGGLDPPPGATAADTSPSRPDLEPAIGPDGKVMPSPQGPQRRTLIDWLLN
ncbi:MAG: hypothetical protein E6G80_00380 [Alphaproteobacteria bacterium]|nr:MAG: hypothetical protein E6G80_00380 [Alphaproteobacteria bacterium]TMJ97471.1 MAG: hypothetical protein E6G77_15965 [Alphaproteobacteria bacterium]